MIEDQNKGVLTGVRMPLLTYLHSREKRKMAEMWTECDRMRKTCEGVELLLRKLDKGTVTER